jgi:hypothetical protein
MLKIKTIVQYLGWILVSVVIWHWALVEVNALYPDWDENRGKVLGFLIRLILVFSWTLWLLSFCSDSLIKARFWFKTGIGLAIVLSVIRLVFYKEFNEFLNYLLKK